MSKLSQEACNRRYLSRLGVKDRLHQDILIARVPCGIETVREAWKDATIVHINAPRALMVMQWQGMVQAFRLAEQGSR